LRKPLYSNFKAPHDARSIGAKPRDCQAIPPFPIADIRLSMTSSNLLADPPSLQISAGLKKSKKFKILLKIFGSGRKKTC
jgi:hypothetical protein